ncbi:MAG TPA: DinB family protein [Gemmatimonadaceae bacterium]|nr:DinB family protein [Gemmatimonadaceae bacterium]
MFRTLDDFCDVWKDEGESTNKVLATLTDASLSQAVTADHRTLGRLGWHLAQTIPEMMSKMGLTIPGADEHAPVPSTAKAIADAYALSAAELPRQMRVHWTDASMNVIDEMYGERWTRSYSLRLFVLHQAHHRGQMTVLMRQAGLPMPSLYGPTREEWAQWNQQPPSV